MKKTLLFVATSLLALNAMAQSATDDKKDDKKTSTDQKVKVTPYGFVRNYFDYDSRKTYTVLDGEYNMQPLDENWNVPTDAAAQAAGIDRIDLNAVPSANLLAITTRVGLNLDGPMVLGAKTSGKIEADFAGFSTNNMVLRIRHAFVQLDWAEKGKLMVGQYWHPLSGDIMPEVLGMAAGAPFRPHSRTPQVNYQVYNGHFGITAAVLSQLQYISQGPSNNTGGTTASYSFAYNAIVPEVFLGVNYKTDHIYAQLGADMLTIRPRVHGSLNGVTVAVKDQLTSITPTFYCQYTEPKFGVKFRTLYAQNTSHLNQLNGYAVTAVNADGSWEYEPMRASISYIDFRYGSKYRFNFFVGYMKNFGVEGNLNNFGTAANPIYYIYSKGNYTNINSIYRVAPSISYNVKAFNLGVEYELTAATYGDIDVNGAIMNNDNLRQVTNHRLCLLMKYNF